MAGPARPAVLVIDPTVCVAGVVMLFVRLRLTISLGLAQEARPGRCREPLVRIGSRATSSNQEERDAQGFEE
jgi:hypothetical protein